MIPIKKSRLLALGALLSLLAFTAAAEVPTDPPVFSDPTEFDSPYFPFEPGAFKIFAGYEDGAMIVFMDIYHFDTRTFMLDGEEVECAILEEVEFEDGELVEISVNYFAESDNGDAYYFGEVVDDYEDGEIVGHDGSWLVGGPTEPTDPVETATAEIPAVFMPAEPEVGDAFKPEDLFPLVDETGTVVRVGVRIGTPAGVYEDCILVRETTQLSSDVEYKAYAPGVGVVRVAARGARVALYASTLVAEEDDDDDEEALKADEEGAARWLKH